MRHSGTTTGDFQALRKNINVALDLPGMIHLAEHETAVVHAFFSQDAPNATR